METTLNTEIKATKIDKRDTESINLFRRFYTGVFAEGFQNENEYIPLNDVLSWLYSDLYDSGKTSIIVFTVESSLNPIIVGGVIFDYFDEINIIGLEFIVVSSAYRRHGLGTYFMNYILEDVQSNIGKAPEWVIAEVEPTNFIMHRYINNDGWLKIGMDYKQPSLSESQSEVELWLIAKPIGDKKGTTISTRIIKEFILNYAKYAMHITNPITNPTIMEMFETMKPFELFGLHQIELIE